MRQYDKSKADQVILHTLKHMVTFIAELTEASIVSKTPHENEG